MIPPLDGRTNCAFSGMGVSVRFYFQAPTSFAPTRKPNPSRTN
jgi:hypothetical protein